MENTSGLLVAYPHQTRSRRLSPGYAALNISWYAAFHAALGTGDEAVLLFEDDVELVKDFNEQLAQIMAEVPDDWEMIYLGHCCTEGKEHLSQSQSI